MKLNHFGLGLQDDDSSSSSSSGVPSPAPSDSASQLVNGIDTGQTSEETPSPRAITPQVWGTLYREFMPVEVTQCSKWGKKIK